MPKPLGHAARARHRSRADTSPRRDRLTYPFDIAATNDIEAAIDRLYGLPLEEFTPARDVLAKQLRAGGDKDGAATVKAVRKPTAAAWAVNQLKRRDTAALDELLEVGAALRNAQRAAVTGKGAAALRELSGQRRQLVEAVVRRAVSYLGASGDGQREAIAITLEAALASEAASEAVAAGRLEKALDPPSGFGDVPGLSVVPDLEEAEDEQPSARDKRRAARAERRANGEPSAPDDNEERRRELQAELDRRRAELEQAIEEARSGARDASAARAEVSRLQDALVTANGRAKHALERARDLELSRANAQRALDEVERALKSL